MTRISKNPKERRSEIIAVSQELFHANGYENTSVDHIVGEIGIAKGTFYYHFKSKEDLLEAIVNDFLKKIVQRSEKIVKDKKINAVTKLKMVYFGEKKDANTVKDLSDAMLHKKNRILNEKVNAEIVRRLSPVITKIIEQGKKEGVFHVENTLATVQFLITGSQFVFDDGLFQWNKNEVSHLRKAMQIVFEKTLGAKKGTLNFITKKKKY